MHENAKLLCSEDWGMVNDTPKKSDTLALFGICLFISVLIATFLVVDRNISIKLAELISY